MNTKFLVNEIENLAEAIHGHEWLANYIASEAGRLKQPVPERGSMGRLPFLQNAFADYGREIRKTVANATGQAPAKPAAQLTQAKQATAKPVTASPAPGASADALKAIADEFASKVSPSGQRSFYMANRVALEAAAAQNIGGRYLKTEMSKYQK